MKTPWYLMSLGWLFLFSLSACSQEEGPDFEPQVVTLAEETASDLAAKIRQEVAVEVADGFELDLWASDSLVQDPIAISIDEKGRVFYTQAVRQNHSEFDIRGHRHWITASLSFETIEDRRAFLRENFAETNAEGERALVDLNEDGMLDWRDLTVEKEQVWFVEDATGDGIADRAQLYLEAFNEEITDVANGIEVHDGEVFVTVAPDMWRTTDTNGDGMADKVNSISRGFAVHIGFSGHGLSGAKIGPDGRIYWGIGDIGMNVVDQDGKRWKYPNQGVVVRSELDGSGFEVYARGVRNTHEFDFDKYGNLISEDNDGDHRGERERLVHLIDGSDSGWRTNWQYGKYTDPDNNEYKVWMDERLHVPRWDGQAAYILPPIQNYVNGPTGFVYNPGTALSERWYDHFFVAEFRGSQANSPIHAFSLKPKGASFELASTQEVVRGLLPTGIDFGPDGALYFGDWIRGWEPKNEGRLWKLDVPGEAASPIRQETKRLLAADFASCSLADLDLYLGHQDMRVRKKAQFELVKRGDAGYDVLLAAARENDDQLARIHGLWGIGQMARRDVAYANELTSFLQDDDPEIIAQAAHLLGDIRYKEAATDLIPLLAHDAPRIRLKATEALGRIADPAAHEGIVEMLRENDDEDAWLRHAGAIALARVGAEQKLIALNDDPSRAVRTAAVVALRRLSSPRVAAFLQDPDPYVVAEAARAINDDWSIEEAIPDLAAVLEEERFTGEPLLRRAINANLREGEPANIDRLIAYAQREGAPDAMRAEALAALSTWAKPSVFDRVDGRYRGVIERDAAPVRQAIAPVLNDLLLADAADLQVAAAEAAVRLEIDDAESTLMALLGEDEDPEVRRTALQALDGLGSASLSDALRVAFEDKSQDVRAAALEILPESDIPEDDAVALFQRILEVGSIEEKQAALASLGVYQGEAAISTLTGALDKLLAGEQAPEIQLDILEAAENQNNEQLDAKLATYHESKPADDPLADYREALAGGDARRGGRLFYRHEEAQCVRCHAIFERGGNAGPVLAGVGDRLSPEQILESMVLPSARLAPGYGVVILELQGGEAVSGIVLEETDSAIRLKIGNEDIRTVQKGNVAKREDIPSSMPAMGDILTKRELRDLVAFLVSLRAEET